MLHDVIGASRFDELMIKMGCTAILRWTFSVKLT